MKAQTTQHTRRRLRTAGAVALALGMAGTLPAVAAQDPGRAVIDKKCASCHLEDGKLTRIPEMRKSPEGWDMTVVRMGIWHKVELTAEERRAVVKYLADRQGLAPSEAAPFRFLTERRPNMQDTPPDDEMAQMCGRCHSYGRVALQRRDEDEWRKLMHTHLGQFPSAEYSALGRDRNWWEIARDKMPGRLAEMYPKNTDAWRDWSRAKHKPADGRWIVAGERPGWGAYTGTMTVTAKGKDRYEVGYELHFGAGNTVRGKGESIVYTGYEWRGSAQLGNEQTQSIFALSEDGGRMSGRWFLRNADEIGATFEAVRADKVAKNAVVAVAPHMLRAGDTATVTVAGAGLDAQLDLGPGVEIVEWLGKSAEQLKLRVKVAADAAPGLRKVAVGGRESDESVAVYRQIDSVRVEPAFGIARVGGGTNPPMTAQFDAVAFLDGADGKPGTDDDVRLGSVPAKWSTEPFDERAKHDEDLKFAGHMEPHGQFLPSFAGPNPNRRGLNNVGNLAVVATVQDGERTLDAKGQLMVTVQRWNTPPLR